MFLNKAFNFTKIGYVGLGGHGVEGYTPLKVKSLMTLFCKTKILSNTVLKADPQTSIAYDMRVY